MSHRQKCSPGLGSSPPRRRPNAFACEACGKSFHTKKKLGRHHVTHQTERPLSCNVGSCTKTFRVKAELHRHLASHSSVRPFSCPFPGCNSVFRIAEQLKRHAVTHTARWRFNCAVCGWGFHLRHTLTAHLQRVHCKTKRFACSVCPAAFFERIGLTMHRRSHTGERPYACSQCDGKFTVLSNLQAHRSRMHATARRFWHCANCGKGLRSKLALVEHVICAHGKPMPSTTFRCEVCAAVFCSQHRLHNHRSKHRQRCTCAQCGIAFCGKLSLVGHQIAFHSEIRQFGCAVCLRYFVSRASLKQHLQQHTGRKAFACSLCPAQFGTKHQFENHRQHHGGTLRFLCAVCRHASYTKPVLLRHISETHYPGFDLGCRPFSCDVCGRAFSRLFELQHHQAKGHPSLEQRTCAICRKTFKRPYDLKLHEVIHIVRVHDCLACGKRCKSAALLSAHRRSHTRARNYICSACGKAFKTAEYCRRHESLHREFREIRRCARCLEGFNDRARLNEHLLRRCGPPGRRRIREYKKKPNSSHAFVRLRRTDECI